MNAIVLISFSILPFIQLNTGIKPAEQKQDVKVIKINKEKFVERHNYHRKKVGVPDVEWSDEIADYAQKWANRLALSCKLQHRSAKHDYGENICMAPLSYTEADVVDVWASEEEYFDHKNPVFRHKDLYKYGHYSQVIWRKTKKIGAGAAKCAHGSSIWVCNYDPPGNYIDEKVY